MSTATPRPAHTSEKLRPRERARVVRSDALEHAGGGGDAVGRHELRRRRLGMVEGEVAQQVARVVEDREALAVGHPDERVAPREHGDEQPHTVLRLEERLEVRRRVSASAAAVRSASVVAPPPPSMLPSPPPLQRAAFSPNGLAPDFDVFL